MEFFWEFVLCGRKKCEIREKRVECGVSSA